ncbi:hypothetical protein CMI37_24640 [Candidatus Pacearchaeota archaeon]|nr:hypothetical protein [Candidatus Pacearchaeota archaeon]|tara:strand:- start:4024 stop:4398 length:375 start_codon:yes stop_codon:yes gene_type:complete
MGVTTSAVSDPLFTTVVVDAEANTTVETFNDAATTLYAIEIENPNKRAVWVRINWAASGDTNSTQNDNIFHCPAARSCYYYFASGYDITAGMRVWCSTNKGLGSGVTLASPAASVTVRMAFKDT